MNHGVYVDIHSKVRPGSRGARAVVAATGNGVYISDDSAASWRRITVGSEEGYAVGVGFNPLACR